MDVQSKSMRFHSAIHMTIQSVFLYVYLVFVKSSNWTLRVCSLLILQRKTPKEGKKPGRNESKEAKKQARAKSKQAAKETTEKKIYIYNEIKRTDQNRIIQNNVDTL